MWAAIRWLVLRLAAVRWIFKLSGLALLVPLAFLLKIVGLPLLAVLAVVGLPILFLLLVFGLPIIMVLVVGGLLMGVLGAVLSIGIAALKIGLFVILPIWLVWILGTKLYYWITGRGNGGKHNGGEGGTAGTSGTSTPAPPPPPADEFDPA
jgi:hypothetical protein